MSTHRNATTPRRHRALGAAALGCTLGVGAIACGAGGCDDDEARKRKAQLALQEPKPWNGEAPFVIDVELSNASAVDAARDGIEVTVRATRVESVAPPRELLRWTPEPWVLWIGDTPEQLDESDIAGSGLAFDLDGDGATTSSIPMRCLEDGSIELGGARFPTLATGETPKPEWPEIMRYGDSVPTVGERGAPVVVYTACNRQPLVIGLSKAGAKIPVLEARGPTIQVLVIEEADGPNAPLDRAPRDLHLDGAKDRSAPSRGWTYERSFGDELGWATVYWWMLPLTAEAPEHELRFALEPALPGKRRQLIASINLAKTSGERRRMAMISEAID